MFGRRKGKKTGANRLSKQAKPNELSWAAADAEAADDEELDDEELDDEELDDEELEAEYEDEDEPDSEDEVEIARRQEELQAELERQAEEFGLANYNVASVYGENGEAVAELLDDLEEIDVETAEAVADAWMARDASEREIVERELRRRHRTGQHQYELSAADDAVTTWLSRKLTTEPEDGDLWRVVAEAARAAVDALVLDQELDDADYDALYGPWGEVMDVEEDEGEAGESAATAASGEEAAAEESDPAEYGPNTDLVRAFLVKLGGLQLEALTGLTAAWKDQDRRALKQAHDSVRDLVKEDPSWRDQVRGAQDLITGWAERVGGTVGASSAAALAGGANAIAVAAADLAGSGKGASQRLAMERLLEAKREAVPAAVDAITALVLADLLEPEDGEMLYRPWEDAIGEPALPEFDGDSDDSNETDETEDS